MGRDRGWGWCREGHTSGKEHEKQITLYGTMIREKRHLKQKFSK